MHLFVCGYPGEVGGANTELWHTVKLWRRFGVGVSLIPTWTADPAWRRRLESIGCRTCQSNPDDMQNVPGLAGSVVVSMCNTRFLAVAARFRELGCKIVWLGCMNWLFPEERRHYREHGVFDRHVFQSRCQHDRLRPQLAKFGYDDGRGRIIRGAFDVAEFPFRPRSYAPGETFVAGRLSRPAPEKFSPRTWEIFGRLPPPMAARVMGWDPAVQARVGRPPHWAKCLLAGTESAQEFLARLHCLVQAGGGAVENWPRVGLEAMAAGVPLIVENIGGWREMVRHDETGCLCDTSEAMVQEATRLMCEPKRRLDLLHQARRAIENELADPETWWRSWSELLSEM